MAEYRKNESDLKQKVKTDPHDVRAWRLLGWNAAYNLSTTSDDVKERYAHVKRGIEYLMEGIKNNPADARLLWDTGWFVYERIGRGKEHQEYRKLFQKDTEFHKLLKGHIDLRSAAGPDGMPDGFLVGRLWFENLIAMLEKQGTLRDFAIAEEIVCAQPAQCQIRYAAQIDSEGRFDTAASAWKEAQKMWEALGNRELSRDDGTKYRLKDSETARKIVNYDHWMNRCRMEQTEAVLAARRSIYRAEQQLANRKPGTASAIPEARRLYEQGFRAWADSYKAHVWLKDDSDLEDELAAVIKRYQTQVLEGKELPKDFPLRHVVENRKN